MPKATLALPRGTVVPDHIGVILDGNRRWARARGLSPTDGHKAGYFAMRKVIEAARQLGVHTLTVWGFSTENWERPRPEIDRIMKLVGKALQDVKEEAHREQIRFVHLGRKDRLPKSLVNYISKLEEETKHYKRFGLNLALDYGGRDEILRAVKNIVIDGVSPDRIDEKLFASYLDTAGQPYPYPDLFIRTSGEQRMSGFLPWQMTYAEFYWERDHLPDMTPLKLREAILDYSRRRRRFGGNDELAHLRFKPEVTAKFEIAWWRLSKIPEGTKFVDFVSAHVKEQFGLSSVLAAKAAKYITEALVEGNGKKWEKAAVTMKKFYSLVRSELKLAFEPSIVASLEVKLLQKIREDTQVIKAQEVEEISRELVAEVYRISDFQAAKAGHLRALASMERNLAESGEGEEHWDNAKDYLVKYYKALKDRVA